MSTETFLSILYILLFNFKVRQSRKQKTDECEGMGCDACRREGELSCCNCPADNSNNPMCFPDKSTVNLSTGKTVKMSELQIGDKVQTGIKLRIWSI